MTSGIVSGCVHGVHVRNYFVFNIIIFGSRHGIIETAFLTYRHYNNNNNNNIKKL